jgi:hypothetical protein
MILGNEMVFDEEGLYIEFKINSVAKRLTITDERVGNRPNIMILGDIKADVNMAQNVKNKKNVISIGFLNKPKDLENDVKSYLEVYDIVIARQGSWKKPVAILKEILGMEVDSHTDTC